MYWEVRNNVRTKLACNRQRYKLRKRAVWNYFKYLGKPVPDGWVKWWERKTKKGKKTI